MQTKNRINYIDLFAGCGGLSEGFGMSQLYNGLAHVEWELPMVETLRKRLKKTCDLTNEESKKKVIHYDIQDVDGLINGISNKQVEDKYLENNSKVFISKGLNGILKTEKVDLIIGGPPCQAYSIAGRAQDKFSMKNDYRNYLFESFAKLVDYYRPKMFLFENVGGILSATPGDVPVLERIYDAFMNIGYFIREPRKQKESLLNSNDFGVPQNRKRVIIIGVDKNSDIDLESVYDEIDNYKIPGKPTLENAIIDLPKYYPNNEKTDKDSHKTIGLNTFEDHKPRYHNIRDIEIFRNWINLKMNEATIKEKLDFYQKATGKISNHNKYRNLEWDKPSPTIVSHLNKDGLLFIHPDADQARSITVREAARIQTFPDDFEFLGNKGVQYKMIGNAVPPLMARQISMALSVFIR